MYSFLFTDFDSSLRIEWQQMTRWQLLMNSLTMPSPSVPSLIAVGRTYMRLTWSSAYVPAAADKSVFGFRITICALAPSYSSPSIIEEEDYYPSSLDSSSCFTRELPRGEALTQCRGGVFEANLEHLVPATTYTCRFSFRHFVTSLFSYSSPILIRVSTFYGTVASETLPTAWSAPFTTLPPSSPSAVTGRIEALISSTTGVKLRFATPLDDGGEDILGYAVYGKYTDPYMLPTFVLLSNGSISKTTTRGKVITLRVHNLIPDAAVTLRVSSHNILGESKLSEESVELRVPRLAYVNIVYGEAGRGAGLVLHDQKEVIVLPSLCGLNTSTTASPDAGTSSSVHLNVWRSHYSRRTHGVQTNQIYLAPLTISSLNTTAIIETRSCCSLTSSAQGSISFIRRSETPLITTLLDLQSQGAAGIVVFDRNDSSARCAAYDQHCFPGSDQRFQEGFGACDKHTLW